MDTGMRPRLERTPEATDELWEIAQQYWALNSLDSFGKPVWSVPRAADRDTDVGKSGDLAGAGARAYIDRKACATAADR